MTRTQAIDPALQFCCYGCRVLGRAGRKPAPEFQPRNSAWFKVGLGAALSAQVMVLDLGLNLAEPQGPARAWLHGALLLATVGVLTVLGPPLIRAAREDWPRLRFEALFLAGIFGALATSLTATFTGNGPVYYEVVALVLTVYTVGKTLAAQSRARALAEARSLEAEFDRCQCLEPDGTVALKPVGTVAPRDRVRVRPGDPIPIDGRIVSGEALVRDTPLTGEPFPVTRRIGDPVLAGSYCEDGTLIIEATRPGNQRRLDELLALAGAARATPARLQNQADALVQWFLPVVLLVAMGTALGWTLRGDWTAGLFNALVVLLVACPCAMGLATPLALWQAISTLAARGLVLRSADAVEQLATIDSLLFDKTGTLSEEECAVVDFVCVGAPADRPRLLALIQAIQAASPHPFANAFRALSPSEPANLHPNRLRTVPARGLEACVGDHTGAEYHVRIGRREFVVDHANPESPVERALLEQLRHTPGDHLVYVAVDAALQGIAAIRERARASAPTLFAALAQLGIKATVLTGDAPERAAQLGFPQALGSMTPLEKAAKLHELRRQGSRVGFVGDGINDSPAMQAAAVGIALSHGAPLTQANASAILYGGDLSEIPRAIAICRRVHRAIHHNLLFAVAYNLFGIALAAAGQLHPVAAALLMMVSSFTVSSRALGAARVESGACLWEAPPVMPLARAPIRTRAAGWVSRVLARARASAAAPTFATAGVLLALQGPFLGWLGGLSLWTSGAVALLMALAGVNVAAISRRVAHARNPILAHYWRMTAAMLSIGNWGMLLGWWLDMQLAAIPQGQCPCSGGQWQWSWMYAGMLLLGLPAMLREPLARSRRRGPPWLLMLSTGGMLLGMSWGGKLALIVAGQPWHFLLAFAGMTLGMLLGMTMGCALGDTLLPTRQYVKITAQLCRQ